MSRPPRSQRLATVVRLARRAEGEAARGIGEARRALDTQRRRLQELKAYRREYARQLESQGQAGVSLDRLNSYRDFLARLDEAIAQLQQQVAACEAELERRILAWRQARLRQRAMETCRQRWLGSERRAAEAREQRECDEHAARRRN